MGGFEHHLAGTEHRADIIALFRESYRRDFPDRAWTWRFVDAPAGSGIVALVSDGGRLASHYAATPVGFSVDGRDALTALAGMTMTGPAYRGQGLFQQAAGTAYAEMRRRGMRFVWGFPNSQIHRQRRRDLGWSTIAEVPMLRLRPGASWQPKRQPRPTQPARSIGPAFDALWQRVRGRHRLIARRDAGYLNWRYLLNPTTEYRVFTIGAGDAIDGYGVVKLHQGELQIVDLLADDDATFVDLVAATIRLAQAEDRPSVALWYNVHDARHLLLEGLGFVNDAPVTYLAGKPLGDDDAQPPWLDYRHWYLTMGDSDVF